MDQFLGGAASGIIQIAIAVLLVYLALKVFKNLAKGLVIAIVVVAGFLLVKGIIDWAMITAAGESLFEWIKQKVNGISAGELLIRF